MEENQNKETEENNRETQENQEFDEENKEQENKESEQKEHKEETKHVKYDKDKKHHEEYHEHTKSKKDLYNKYYKLLLLIPAILLVFSLVYIAFFYYQTGDIINKDVSLTGGTTITVSSNVENINIYDLKQNLQSKFSDVVVRGISDLRTGRQQAFVVESSAEPEELKPALEDYLNFELSDENSSTEFTGSTLSQSFYKQLRLAIIFAFLFMAIVVFIIFRKILPSFIVILSAFADIVMTLALVDILGIKLSSAGVVAFLMLIGYSVDTDIMLTTKLIKRREGSINSRILEALKTGLTMTLTSIAAVLAALFITISLSSVLSQIFLILVIGLSFDLLNTWITNASLLKWYSEKKESKHGGMN